MTSPVADELLNFMESESSEDEVFDRDLMATAEKEALGDHEVQMEEVLESEAIDDDEVEDVVQNIEREMAMETDRFATCLKRKTVQRLEYVKVSTAICDS